MLETPREDGKAESLEQTRKELRKQRKTSTNQKRYTITIIALLCVVWSGLFFLGLYSAYQFKQETQTHLNQLQHNLDEAKQVNEEKITQLTTQFSQLQDNLASISKSLATADETLSHNAQVRESLNQKIAQLDQQLTKLQKALEQLKKDALITPHS